jgi:hypothetical protein
MATGREQEVDSAKGAGRMLGIECSRAAEGGRELERGAEQKAGLDYWLFLVLTDCDQSKAGQGRHGQHRADIGRSEVLCPSAVMLWWKRGRIVTALT